MVVRGGYAISSYLEGTGTNLRMPLNPPFESEFQTYYNTPAFTLPGAPSIGGDGQESIPFDLAMLGGFVLYNAGLFYWVYRHRQRYVAKE